MAKDCEPLVGMITARVKTWAVRFLSYAGRLQLIQSVIFNMTNFWCRQFILPKGVIKQVCQICVGFLWKGKESSTRGARVS